MGKSVDVDVQVSSRERGGKRRGRAGEEKGKGRRTGYKGEVKEG